MMRLRSPFLLPLLGAASLVVSCTKSPAASAPRDAGGEDAAADDAALADSPSGALGTLVQAGSDLVLYGVTGDGYAIYSAAAMIPTILAAPLAGGAPSTVTSLTSSQFSVTVTGNVVTLYDAIQPTGLATLETWSSATGFHTITTSTYFGGEVQVSPDSQHLVYVEHFDPSTSIGDVVVANIDGTTPKLLEASVPGLSIEQTCLPQLSFVGTSLVLTYCTGTSTPAQGNVYSFAPPSWKQALVVENVYPAFSIDPTGKNLLVFSGATAAALLMEAVPVAGGKPIALAPGGTQGLFTSDGQKAIYVTASGALGTTPVSSWSPTTLIASGVGRATILSPDNETALFFESASSTTGLCDLYAASTVTPGAPVTLDKAETSLAFGTLGTANLFTGDSSHVVFFTNVGSGTTVGGIEAMGIGASSSPSTLATASNTVWTTGASEVVFANQLTTTPSALTATLDIEMVDLASAGSPTVLVSEAIGRALFGQALGPAFFLSPKGDAIVYTQNAAHGAAAGLYTLELP